MPQQAKNACSIIANRLLNVLKIYVSAFGIQALCYWMLSMSYQGDVVMIFLTLGIGSFGLSVAGKSLYVFASYSCLIWMICLSLVLSNVLCYISCCQKHASQLEIFNL